MRKQQHQTPEKHREDYSHGKNKNTFLLDFFLFSSTNILIKTHLLEKQNDIIFA